jgi:hypothetical protein
MAYSPIELREMAEHLLDIARRLAPEAEGFDPDEDFSMEELVQLRSHLSATRKACDMVNSGLARYWKQRYGGGTFEDEHTVWFVDHGSVRRPIDTDLLLSWFMALPPDRWEKVVNPNRLAGIIKKTGLSGAEYETLFIDEKLEHRGIGIQQRDKR